MEEPKRKFMKVGLVHYMAYPETLKGEGPILETLRKIAIDPYFDLVEVSWIKDPKVRKDARDLLKTSGLEAKYGVQPRLLVERLDLNSLDEAERSKAVRAVKEGVDEALEIEATGLALMSGKYPGEAKKNEALRALASSLKEICEYADGQKSGFPVVLEIFDREVDKKCLIGPASDARKVAVEVSKEFKNFGLMHDLSHLPLLKETPKQALESIKDYLVHVHLGNCVLKRDHPAFGDQHPRFGIEYGENDVDQVMEFLKALFEVNYLDGKKPKPLSLEVKPLLWEDPEVIIANAKRVLDEAWARYEQT